MIEALIQALAAWLLAASFFAPLALVALCFSNSLRRQALALQWLAPAPALAAGLLGIGVDPFSLEFPALRLSLRLDLPGALLLTVAALLWMVVGAGVFRDEKSPPSPRVAVAWLLTMVGSLGVFVAADLISFYLVYALVSIPAYGLIAWEGRPNSRRAGNVYMAFAIAGEALLLLAFVLLAAGEPQGSLRIVDVMATLPGSPWRDLTLALLIAGFGMKMGLAPLNGWMPLTYRAAPIPAAAVLSGAGVKAGVIGLIRFLPLGAALENWGLALAAIGFFSAFYGVAIGLTQKNPKTVLAYSSISQMGVIAAALGMALMAGEAGAASSVGFYAANHALVKGALFMTIGAFASNRAAPLWWLVIAGALALSLAGLPFSGGALAKLASKSQFASGWAAALAAASSVATALLMLHFLSRLRLATAQAENATPAALVRLWPTLALGALLLPWALYPVVGDVSEAFGLAKLWDGVWPLLIAAALAYGFSDLQQRLPRIHEGDSVVVFEKAYRKSLALGGAFEGIDIKLRQWPAAGLSLVLIALVLAAATAMGR
jgi:formate hydrogenlyase subunit 3/multisubunit Na+/H+ antiporter MnhD subunit